MYGVVPLKQSLLNDKKRRSKFLVQGSNGDKLFGYRVAHH